MISLKFATNKQAAPAMFPLTSDLSETPVHYPLTAPAVTPPTMYFWK